MPQRAVELILMRQLASYLSVPVLIIGPDEVLVYYNEAAAAIVGQPYSEVETFMLSDIETIFQVTDESGRPVAPEDLPLTAAVKQHRPVHARLMGKSLGGEPRHVEVTALPLRGQGGRWLGAAAIIWEVPSS